MKAILAATFLVVAALAACAPVTPGAPAPVTRFESGGGSIAEVRLHSGMRAELEGQWEGTYAPYNPVKGVVTGPPVGVTALVIREVDDTLARGRIVWAPNDGSKIPGRDWTAALTVTGHFMFMNSHAMMMEQDGVRYFQADIILDDGKSYLHRWIKTAG
ncbi:MAG: hypothetical protein ACI9ZH_002027 [Paracoccaceae bacterium]|jgi:hypothetical protein